MTSPPIGTDQELIDYLRNEGRARNRHEGPNARLHKCELAADALQSRISEVERLKADVALLKAHINAMQNPCAALSQHRTTKTPER